jgi:exonuclease SbcC
MRLRKVALRGLVRFKGAEPVSYDLDALGPGLVAIVGDNGEGKTTCVEAVATALFKDLPSRVGNLYDHVHGRDAFAEAVFEDDDGRELKARVQIDVDRRTTEGYLFRDGVSLTTGRAKEFEAQIEQRFGSKELFYASVFAVQTKAGSFVRASKAQRKALFAELLGLGRLEVLHEAAKDRRTRAELALGEARAKVRDLETEIAAGAALEEQREGAQLKADAAAHQLETAREEEASATSTLERARAAAGAIRALEEAEEGARREVEAAQRALGTAEDLAPKARAAAHGKRLTLRAGDPDVAEASARRRHKDGVAALEQRRSALEEQAGRLEAVRKAQADLPALEAARDLLEARTKEVDQLAAEGRVAKAELDHAHRDLNAAEASAKNEQARLERQAGLLKQAPCSEKEEWYPLHGLDGEGEDLAGSCPLLADARAARDQLTLFRLSERTAEAVAVVETAEEKVQDLLARIEVAVASGDAADLPAARAAFARAQLLAAQAPHVEDAVRQLDGLAIERVKLEDTLARDLADVEQARSKVREAEAAIDSELNDTLLEAAEKVELAQEEARGAAKRLREADGKLQRARVDVPDVAKAACALADAQGTRKRAETALREADRELATIQGKVDRIRELEASVEPLRADVASAEQDLGDWNLLEQALGRDGIQALEIDAAGPEVTRLTNELLAACYGPRFSITFETQREKKSGRGEYSEAFDVIAYDGREPRKVENLSGGEQVIVGEALSLGIAIFNSRKSGVRWKFLMRDETAGALDPQNAVRYLDMLRRALSLGGFEQIIFIAHQQDLADRADVRLRIHGGNISIDGARVSAPTAVAVA